KKDSTFGLYWFANGDSSYSKPILLTSAEWFDECGFSIGKRPGFLGFGRFYSDIGKFYQWDDKLHLLREIVTDEGEDSTATDVE
ncbi:MAG TPA: hypothetical protein VMG34_03235, partial [Bacteroidota bacterium]|nr:hypothetical protein [Bacteroidota bacterium]